ncbi:hypothetical protein CVT24_006537 [Panaeolus cyanescens]|uniref:G domain-containing protein n=1 Tax=Panaeolus cyanescens TaxID=181874 RepID=A0A409WNN8_9AGAR|nr:hypothetical protein CVT24_006537 [Panaeolus cyanescens]
MCYFTASAPEVTPTSHPQIADAGWVGRADNDPWDIEGMLSFLPAPLIVSPIRYTTYFTAMPFVQTGEVSVERYSGHTLRNSFRIALLGGTGSGKSSFIEALAGSSQKLGISGGTLESVTQEVQAYKVINLEFDWNDGENWPLYLVDTPGLLDSKMSDAEVITKIRNWMETNSAYLASAFFFWRITDTRIPGSGQRLMNLIKSLGIRSEPRDWAIVTTMWDTIVREEAKTRAEDNFERIRDDIWKSVIEKGGKICKFQNSQPSAIDLIITTDLVGHGNHRADTMGNNPLTQRLIVAELLDRIENERKHRHTLQDNRIDFIRSNWSRDLDAIYLQELRDADQQLIRHIKLLVSFRDLPSQFASVHTNSMVYRHLLETATGSQKVVHAIEKALDKLGSTSSTRKHRGALKKALRDAKGDCMQAYKDLQNFGPPPPGFDAFIPDVTLTISERMLNLSANTGHFIRRIIKH